METVNLAAQNAPPSNTASQLPSVLVRTFLAVLAQAPAGLSEVKTASLSHVMTRHNAIIASPEPCETLMLTICASTRLHSLHTQEGEDATAVRLFACYLAAITHDFEHRGVTNDFLIRCSDPLALIYNDISPLVSTLVENLTDKRFGCSCCIAAATANLGWLGLAWLTTWPLQYVLGWQVCQQCSLPDTQAAERAVSSWQI